MPPSFLLEVQRRNVQARNDMLKQQEERARRAVVSKKKAAERVAHARAQFQKANQMELMATCIDADACVICSESDDSMMDATPVQHQNCKSTCKARAHTPCLERWREKRDAKGIRVFKCPACNGKMAGVTQPPARKKPVCATPFGGGWFCKLPTSHLGVCSPVE